ncbi:MAG: hypothetical protein IT384_17560 [Deltaproteobacteria bacterium]|nr:hypothetical protein [Deltaproteobacteria bacterium]
MKLIDELVARATAAEDRIGDLADQETKNEQRRAAYGELERMFDKAAGDGYLDQREIQDLMAAFRAQGLDTATLEKLANDLKGRDATSRIDVTGELRDQIADQLRDAKISTNDPHFQFNVQMNMAEYQQSFDLASRVSKAEHEIYMAAIRHLVC